MKRERDRTRRIGRTYKEESSSDRYKSYRDKWNNIDFNNIADFPLHIDFELVDSCNQRCDFCPRNSDTHPELPYKLNTNNILSENILEKILEESRENGLYSINFAWGEPLLFKNIIKLVNHLHQVGVVDSRIITNGLLLHKYIEEILDSSLIYLFVSIDATSEDIYKLQHGPGYTKVVENVREFISKREEEKKNLPIVRVSFVENEKNKHQKEEFISLWKDVVDFVDIKTKADFNKKTINKTKKWKCVDPFRRVSVLANGDIIPCCSFHGRQLVIGNVKTMTIKEAWHSTAMDNVRKELLNGGSEVCQICQELNDE